MLTPSLLMFLSPVSGLVKLVVDTRPPKTRKPSSVCSMHELTKKLVRWKCRSTHINSQERTIKRVSLYRSHWHRLSPAVPIRLRGSCGRRPPDPSESGAPKMRSTVSEGFVIRVSFPRSNQFLLTFSPLFFMLYDCAIIVTKDRV